MSNNLNTVANNSAILAQVAKTKNDLASTVKNECETRFELVKILMDSNNNLTKDKATNILHELDETTGKLYIVDSICEVGNPANNEKYAKYLEKYGNEIQLLLNTISSQQTYNVTVQSTPPAPQVGMNITPYVVGNQQPVQAVCVSGVQEIDNTIAFLAEARELTVKENMDDLRDILEAEILKSKSTEEEKKELLKRLRKFCSTETNIMLVGATGSGKSSTINALFACSESEGESNNCVEVAKVGSKAAPETKDVEKYKIGNLVLWDTPGLGDGTEVDKHHKEVITELLREKDEDGNMMIDLVLVILDGSTRDLGTSYNIINDVIIPELKDETGRILIGLNQADIAMKTGRHWNYETNEPDDVLMDFLNEKVESIKERIKKDSDIDVEPVYYCAGYVEESGDVVRPYNLSKLLYYILGTIPAQKRIAVMEGINAEADNYECNDDDMDYNEGVKDAFYESFDYISDGVDTGAEIGGSILGIPGALVGAVLGGFVGCMRSILDEIF